jgi:hypothetical protein
MYPPISDVCDEHLYRDGDCIKCSRREIGIDDIGYMINASGELQINEVSSYHVLDSVKNISRR